MTAGPALERLAAVMTKLRDPDGGCPWDLEQSFATIAPYTIEEAYEVAQAVRDDDLAALKEELGDLQLQVVYHAQMAAEAGAFTLAEVVEGIADKMVKRHPHVFGDAAARASSAHQKDAWEAQKAGEREGGALAGVALALPALMRAQKLGSRAARVGFDWPDASGSRAKVFEELAEIDAAEDEAERAEEVGDLLFAAVNYARHLGVDAEEALRAANAKFEVRFAAMERAAGDAFPALSLDEKEALWVEVKRSSPSKMGRGTA